MRLSLLRFWRFPWLGNPPYRMTSFIILAGFWIGWLSSLVWADIARWYATATFLCRVAPFIHRFSECIMQFNRNRGSDYDHHSLRAAATWLTLAVWQRTPWAWLKSELWHLNCSSFVVMVRWIQGPFHPRVSLWWACLLGAPWKLGKKSLPWTVLCWCFATFLTMMLRKP